MDFFYEGTKYLNDSSSSDNSPGLNHQDEQPTEQKKTCLIIKHDFQKKSNIYNKVRVFNKVYGKEIVDKKA